MWFIYILKSEVRKRYYIGVTTKVDIRLIQHNAGHTKSTKPYRPWRLIYKESFELKTDAFKKEYFLKHPEGYKEKLEIINKYGGVA